MIGFEESIILINCVEHDYLRKKFGVVYIRRHTVLYKISMEYSVYYLNIERLLKPFPSFGKSPRQIC